MAHKAATAQLLISLTGIHSYTWVERRRRGINCLLRKIQCPERDSNQGPFETETSIYH
ncbi:hypothetical protein DPMN_065188 [Dreissena polymorpha]|uniref:Uncharacterized protein n=1 Tax=Dreissena polymorpha TaxID=45954 RepID=A0A9D4CDL4_DREPO|nr:hypothetical protein DPMN_065188 [Dreissena polymorpha]